MTETKYPVSGIVVITVFYSFMVFLIFQTFKTGGYAPLVLLPPLFATLMAYSFDKEWNPIHKNPNFIALDGTISVVEDGLRPIHGGRSLITISTKKDYLPKEKWYLAGGMKSLFSHLAGKVQHDIKDFSWKFVPIVGESLGAKEGAYLYLGSLSGKPVIDVNGNLMKKLDEAYSIIRNQETLYERAKQLSNTQARGNNLDMVEVAQLWGVITREWGETLNKAPINYKGGLER